jgi:hypothetical protein
LEPTSEVIGSHDVGEVRPTLVMAFVVEALTVASLVVRFIGSTCPLVYGWFGLVSRVLLN